MTSLRQKHGWIILLLGLLSVVTPFAIDMYLPAFSRMAGDLKTTTTVISLSLSSYFIGFALGQILYGPLLDRFGRKRPLYFGLILYILASVGCAQAHSIHALIVIRFIQALGGCAAQVAAIAMVRDFFPVNENAKVLSLLFLIIGVSPLLAPTIGSALVSALGWRWIFILLAANAFMILTLTFTLLPEGHTPDASISLKPKPIIQNFWTIFRQPQFITYALSGAFSFAGLFAFVAGSPIIFMGGFQMSPKAFGLTFAVLVMGFIGGNQVNVFLLRRLSSQRIFFHALLFQVFTGLVFLAGTRIHVIGLPAMLALFFFFLLSIGLTTPNAAALGLAPFSRDAGSASALLGSLQAGTGSLISTGIGVLGASAIVKLMAGTAFAALIILIAGRTRIVELTETSESEAVSVLH
ncbi:MAG TPA: multidrug effflux MFS transporter [Edaphobacter sp.]|nr:multidrug effflux MFS transporter [Edaphobacter sp.]